MATAALSSELARECADIGIPVVMINRYAPASLSSTVPSKNLGGGHLVARFLVAAGHERIAFISGVEDSSTNRDRETGFCTATRTNFASALNNSLTLLALNIFLMPLIGLSFPALNEIACKLNDHPPTSAAPAKDAMINNMPSGNNANNVFVAIVANAAGM